MLTLHAAPDGYALAFVGRDHEQVAAFPTFDAAARALRAAEAAALKIASLQSYNHRSKLRP